MKKVLITGITLVTLTILIMGLFNFFKPKNNDGKFVTESDFAKNKEKQIEMIPETLEQLRKAEVTEDKELKLEFFFYTNTSEKAKIFASELQKLNYEVEHGTSAGDKNMYVITGWTTKIKMNDAIVLNWTKEMCELGYKFDCDFDGWGTSPDQD